MAGGVSKLAEICGCNHGSIIYLRDSGKPLKKKWAVIAGAKLGIRITKLDGTDQ